MHWILSHLCLVAVSISLIPNETFGKPATIPSEEYNIYSRAISPHHLVCENVTNNLSKKIKNQLGIPTRFFIRPSAGKHVCMNAKVKGVPRRTSPLWYPSLKGKDPNSVPDAQWVSDISKITHDDDENRICEHIVELNLVRGILQFDHKDAPCRKLEAAVGVWKKDTKNNANKVKAQRYTTGINDVIARINDGRNLVFAHKDFAEEKTWIVLTARAKMANPPFKPHYFNITNKQSSSDQIINDLQYELIMNNKYLHATRFTANDTAHEIDTIIKKAFGDVPSLRLSKQWNMVLLESKELLDPSKIVEPGLRERVPSGETQAASPLPNSWSWLRFSYKGHAKSQTNSDTMS